MDKKKIFFILAVVSFLDARSVMAGAPTLSDLLNGVEATSTSEQTNGGSIFQNQFALSFVPPSQPSQLPALPKILTRIQDAKTLLQSVELNYTLTPHSRTLKIGKKKKTTVKTITSYTLDNKEIALAILDPATQSIAVIKGIQKQEKFSFPDSKYDIHVVSFNGVNTEFQVNTPANGSVLALKYLLTPLESGSKEAITKQMSEVVYAPYSKNSEQPGFAAYGGAYLKNAIATAALQLQSVPSQSVPGQTIIQAINPGIIKSIIYAEHIDIKDFMQTPDIQSLIDRVNILLAGNGPDTFKYSVSIGNARGIAQFIGSTYRSVVVRHPEANLIPDFVSAMNDHVNAIKAEYLLIDDYIAAVHDKISVSFDPSYKYEYGVASYNGGVGRVASAIKAYGIRWNADHSQELDDVKMAIDTSAITIKRLKTSLEHAKTKKENTFTSFTRFSQARKKSLSNQLKDEQTTLAQLTNQLNFLRTGALRAQTIGYLAKVHKLTEAFATNKL